MFIEILKQMQDYTSYREFALYCLTNDIPFNMSLSQYDDVIAHVKPLIAQGQTLEAAYEDFLDSRRDPARLQKIADGRIQFKGCGAEHSNDFPDVPSLMKNFSKSVAGWVASGLKITKTEVFEQRMVECYACPEISNGRCRICGCFVHGKGKMASEHCPKGKW